MNKAIIKCIFVLMYSIKKLLLVSNLESNQLRIIEKALQLIDVSIDEIMLHYAYQIPVNTQNVIAIHDKIKRDANNKLSQFAQNIKYKTGINTSVSLSLGSEKRTLEHVLNKSKFDYVIPSSEINLDHTFSENFPETQFLTNIL